MKKKHVHNKGLTFESEYGIEKANEMKLKLSEDNKDKIPWISGKHHTEKARKKMREARFLHPSPGMKGKHHTEKTKIKIRESKRGKPSGREGKRNTKEHIRRSLRRRIPSSLEEKFQGILDKYNLPYKYVGDGKFFIERLNPDFVNTNSQSPLPNGRGLNREV